MPMPWIEDDDEENGKKIFGAFREGTSLMCFDEAHVIGGSSLTRALTALTYSDRILGVSKMAAYPNRVTWMALGNQVTVLADLARRAYFIQIYPTAPEPENRPEEDFAHPYLREWTIDNRPELVTSCLVMIRAWFAAGCPEHSRGSRMGSFERWDKMMSGILAYAGVGGFLANLAEMRATRDTTGGFWGAHVTWLHEQFGRSAFTSLDVKVRAMASGGTWDAPPRLDDPNDVKFATVLGLAYARVQDRWFGSYRIVRGEGTAQRKVAKWYVEYREGGTGGTGGTLTPAGPASPGPAPVPGHPGLQDPATGVSLEGTLPEQVFYPDPGTASQMEYPAGPAKTSNWEGDKGVEGVLPLNHSAGAGAGAGARAHMREGGSTPPTPPTPSQPGLSLGLDLETGDAGQMFLAPRGLAPEDGGFVRLAGLIGPSGEPEIVPLDDALYMTAMAAEVYGHNLLGFDGLALAWHHGVNWDEFAAKARDTELIARQVFPPRSRESGASADKRGLDAVAELLGMPGKTDDLARLKRKHGSYEAIPLDDEEFRAYLAGDMHATQGVGGQLLHYYRDDPYLPREHRLAQIAGHMTLNGFAVNQPLLEQRYAEGEERKREALGFLHEGWGLPLTRTVTRGRGKNKTSTEESVDAPLATDAGRDWLAGQWERYQIPAPPLTKTGKLAIGDDDLAVVARDPDCPGDLKMMIALMHIVTGTRTVYQTLKEHLTPDGRVHPRISFRQASGRWSVIDPGLTVLGKHEGRHIERDVLIPDQDAGEPHVLITADLKQVDMRAMAGHSQDPAYMALFGFGPDGKPLDPHTMIAEQVYGTETMRQAAKAVGHGWNYGLGPNRMIREGMDPERVWRFVQGMEARFPVLIGWREEIRAMGKAGMVLDNGFGRRMMAEPARAYTVAPALMGQGGARDIMCECLLRLPRELWRYLRVMVHDEIVLSVPARDAEEIGRIVQAAMTWHWVPPGKQVPVPILCDLSKPGASWGAISDK
jgi:DNA polymerase-1